MVGSTVDRLGWWRLGVSGSQERKEHWHCGQLSIVASVLQMPFFVAGRNNNLAILISSGDGHPGTEDLELFQKEPKQAVPWP